MSETPKPHWIDTAAQVREVAEACGRDGRMALDTEADSMHSYFHKVCLIQVSAGGAHWVVDPLALADPDLVPLWRLLADPAIPVLMHGADYDIRVLDRDYGARVRGLEDTQIMAQLLGEPKTGLAAMLDKELGVRLDKRHQRADWGRRPLSRSQVAYAAADTAHLEALAKRLRARLEEQGRWPWAEEEFRRLETVRHVPPEPDAYAFERIKGARALRGEARDRLFTLHGWREGQAQKLDLPPFKVLGNISLLQIAAAAPADLDALGAVDGVGPRAVRRWGAELLAAVARPEPAPPRQRPTRTTTPAHVQHRIKQMLAVRDERAAALGLQPGLLCARGLIEAIASSNLRRWSRADLVEAGLGGWRCEQLCDAFLAVLDGAS